MNNILKVVVISDTDSRLKWALDISSYFQNKEFFLIAPKKLANSIQKNDFKNLKYDMKSLIRQDVIILGLGGGANYKFLLKFNNFIDNNKPANRPLIISGFNGSTDTDNIHALLCRIGSDFICLNSKKDYYDFSNQLKKINFSKNSLVLTGLPKDYSKNERKLKKDKIVFFAQPDVPKTRRERIYIVKKMQELAKKFPEKGVYIKPRSKKGNLNVTHKEKYYYQDILKELNVKDIHLIYDDVEMILASTYLSITVGSTVAYRSIHSNTDTVVLSDFGIRQEYGNHHFMGSGCLLSFHDILSNKRPCIDKLWKEKYVLIDNTKFDLLVHEVLTKLGKQKNENKMLPLEPLYYIQKSSPYLVENTLRINDKSTCLFMRMKRLIKKVLF